MTKRLAMIVFAVMMVFASSPAVATADVDYGVGSGASVGVLPGAFGLPEMAFPFLEGKPCAAPNHCDPIYYLNPAEFLGQALAVQSMDDGLAKLEQWIAKTPGKKIAMGHSLGASVIYKWLRVHSHDPSAPPPSELSFITMGTPEHQPTGLVYSDPTGMYKYRRDQGFGIPADTPYHVVDVCRKWDGYCYWIPGQSDLSEKGKSAIHIDYTKVDLDDPANQVTVNGNITEVLVPTPGWP